MQMGLNNQGTINANIAGGDHLIVDPSVNATNTGIMEATNGGALELQVTNYANTGGTIQAVGTSSMVILGPDTSFDGGTFTISGGGAIGVTTTNSEHAATLDA